MTFEEAKLALYAGWQVKRSGERYELEKIIIGKADAGGFRIVLAVRDINVQMTYYFPLEEFTLALPGIDDGRFQCGGGLKMQA